MSEKLWQDSVCGQREGDRVWHVSLAVTSVLCGPSNMSSPIPSPKAAGLGSRVCDRGHGDGPHQHCQFAHTVTSQGLWTQLWTWLWTHLWTQLWTLWTQLWTQLSQCTWEGLCDITHSFTPCAEGKLLPGSKLPHCLSQGYFLGMAGEATIYQCNLL